MMKPDNSDAKATAVLQVKNGNFMAQFLIQQTSSLQI